MSEPCAPAAAAIVGGLRGSGAAPPRISQVYLYDDRGSELYEQIVATPEYYLPEIETGLLRDNAAAIANGGEAEQQTQVLVELGAGSSQPRSLFLLRTLEQHCVYVPVDVSSAALDMTVAASAPLVAERAGALQLKPLVGLFEQRLPEAAQLPGRKLFLFLGSSLGNFSDAECVALFRLVASCMSEGDRFVVGVDTPHSVRKPAAMIDAAYNDAQGVTALFTLNALRHVNSVAGLDFDWEHGWKHVAVYDPERRAIVTHVEALRDMDVHRCVGNGDDGQQQQRVLVRSFAKGERIFMETSRKFDHCSLASLAVVGGLQARRVWAAEDEHYLLVELVPSPPQRDEAFLGLHAPPTTTALEALDIYGTLREKSWRAPLSYLLAQLRQAHSAFLAALPPNALPEAAVLGGSSRRFCVSPTEWSIGHVAFSFGAPSATAPPATCHSTSALCITDAAVADSICLASHHRESCRCPARYAR